MNTKVDMKNLELEGAAKWVHRFVMFITYPFRHPYVFLMLMVIACLIAVAIPMFNGISARNIPEWYGEKLGIMEALRKPQIKAAPKKIKASKFKKEIKLKHAAFEPKPVLVEEVVEIEVPEPQAPEPQKYAAWNIKNKDVLHKEEFKAAVVEPEEEKVIQIQEEVEPVVEIQQEAEPIPVEEKKSLKQKTDSSELKYQKREDLALTYYQKPKHIWGEAIIYGANEISVDDTYLYLYGIYTNPNIHSEGQARSYLRELIAGKRVDCYIVAQTKEGIATAICFAAGKNINESMVKAYLADNIAL